jgi:hypothetical protein
VRRLAWNARSHDQADGAAFIRGIAALRATPAMTASANASRAGDSCCIIALRGV